MTTGGGDTIDVVPIGAWRGQGRKKEWFSPFLLAVWNEEREEFQTLCRCLSFTDDMFKDRYERYLPKR